MRSPKPIRVLGVDPGSRHLGTALIEGRELVHHGVFDIAESSSQRTLSTARRVLHRLIEAYEPDALAIERSFFSKGRHAPLLRLVTDEIQDCASAMGVQIRAIAPSSIKKAITGDGHANKQQVAGAVCAVYPQLRAYLGTRRKWQARFHSNMFDAIAAALVFIRQHEELGDAEPPKRIGKPSSLRT